MRRLTCVFAIAATLACFPTTAFAQDRFARAERVGEAELQRVLPGMRAIHVVGPGEHRYRGIEEEQFGTRPARHALGLRNRGTFYALWIFRDLHMGGGSYRLRGNAVCSIVVPETTERCRGLFRLADGSYALSSYEDPTRPIVRIQLLRRSTGR
jgi:hypothetical protein